METRKMVVYEYVGDYGYGIVLVDYMLKDSEANSYKDNKNYKELGVFDLPLDFLKALGYSENEIEYMILDLTYVE